MSPRNLILGPPGRAWRREKNFSFSTGFHLPQTFPIGLKGVRKTWGFSYFPLPLHWVIFHLGFAVYCTMLCDSGMVHMGIRFCFLTLSLLFIQQLSLIFSLWTYSTPYTSLYTEAHFVKLTMLSHTWFIPTPNPPCTSPPGCPQSSFHLPHKHLHTDSVIPCSWSSLCTPSPCV